MTEAEARQKLTTMLERLPSLKTKPRGFIYFVQGEITQLIKIGFSYNGAKYRLKNLQIGSPDLLRFVGQVPATRKTEHVLHGLLKEYRVHGEWYKPSDDLLAFIGAAQLSKAERTKIMSNISHDLLPTDLEDSQTLETTAVN